MPLTRTDDADVLLISGAEGAPLFDLDNLAPGETTSRTVTIRNEGAPADVQFYASGEGELAEALQVTIAEQVNGHYVDRFSGSLAQLLADRDSYENGIGHWSAARGEHRTYRITSDLPPDAGNRVQGESATAALWWEARQ